MTNDDRVREVHCRNGKTVPVSLNLRMSGVDMTSFPCMYMRLLPKRYQCYSG
jgi:hypothetical protein